MTIEYVHIEKKNLLLLRPGFPLAWPVENQMWDEKPEKFYEGLLFDYIRRSSKTAFVRTRGGEIKEVNKFKLYRILLLEIENIDRIYDYDS